MTGYVYDPMQYRSPQRLWDPVKQEFIDQWMQVADMELWTPDGRRILSQAGDVTDKASVPRLAWWYLNRDDKHVIIAARFHDKLYEAQQIQDKWITRKEADQHFYGIILQSGMRPTKAWLAYMVVRAGGWRFYNKQARVLRNPHYVERL